MGWPSSVTGTGKHRRPAFWERRMKCLAGNRNEIRWWEAGRRRERTWEYVHFFMMTILHLILFLQYLKPSPHLPSPDTIVVYLFLPTNLQILLSYLLRNFISSVIPFLQLITFFFYYSQYVWTYFILTFKNSKPKILVLSLPICSSKSLIPSQQHSFLKTFSITFDFNITLVSGAQHSGLTFI